MTTKPVPRKAKRDYGGRPTTVTIYLSATEEQALSDRAKAEKQSVPAFIAALLRDRLRSGHMGEQ